MSKALLVEKAARLAEASAIAAIEAASLSRLGYAGEAEAIESRALRLDSMAADYRRAARLAH
jgi:DNA-binding Xre family transcriptional regulator